MLPAQPWLSRQWLRGWVETMGQSIDALDDDAAWTAHEELAEFAPLRSRVKAIWDARDTLLAIVETAPQTVVHLDFWPTNLIAADDGTTVAIDWSQVGIGALAQDIDQLILDPIWMQVRPGESIEALESHVVRGYTSGLRSSGVDVGEASVRRWYAAAASIHYAPMLAMALARTPDPTAVEGRLGQPYAAIMVDRARVIRRAVELGESVLG
jgi:thiamine kinase-like enzyme